ASATRLDVFDHAHPRSGRPAHAPGAGRRAGCHAQIAPAGDFRRSGARMDRHRPQHLRRGNAEAVGEIRGELLPRTGAQRTRVYKVAASISRILTFGSRRFTASVRSMKPYVRKIHVEKTSR